MFSYVFLQVTRSLKALSAIIKGTMEWSFSRVNSNVGVQITFLSERLAATFVRTHIGPFARLIWLVV